MTDPGLKRLNRAKAQHWATYIGDRKVKLKRHDSKALARSALSGRSGARLYFWDKDSDCWVYITCIPEYPRKRCPNCGGRSSFVWKWDGPAAWVGRWVLRPCWKDDCATEVALSDLGDIDNGG